MKKVLTLAAGVIFAGLAMSSTSHAMGTGPLTKLVAQTTANSGIIKVHSRRAVHDMLHDYGYHRVYMLSKRYGYDGKPIYKFRACMGRRAFHLTVDWYGNVVNRHRDGRCYRYNRYNRYNRQDRYDSY